MHSVRSQTKGTIFFSTIVKAIALCLTGMGWIAFIIPINGCSHGRFSSSISNTEVHLKRGLKAGEHHLYSIYVKEGEFFHARVTQYDIDVVSKLYSEDNALIAIFDLPTSERGAEDIYLLSNRAGNYKIEIIPAQKYADSGAYVIEVVRRQNATANDRKWMVALTATRQADSLRAKAETRSQSIEQYQKAAVAWRVVNDEVQYARAMRSLGFVYIRQGDYNKALETFTQLLPVWKKVGDTRSEGFTHLIIGRIYHLQKDYQTALQHNLRSLPYWEKENDHDQETFTLMHIGNLYAHLGEKQKAVDYFEQALKRNEQSSRPSVKAVVLRDYAQAMMAAGNQQKAVDLYQQSLKQWQRTINKPEEARTAVMLATYFAEKGKKQEAIAYYQQALAIWKRLENEKEAKNIEAALAKLRTE